MRICGYTRFSLGCFDRPNWVIGQRVLPSKRLCLDVGFERLVAGVSQQDPRREPPPTISIRSCHGSRSGAVFLLARGLWEGGLFEGWGRTWAKPPSLLPRNPATLLLLRGAGLVDAGVGRKIHGDWLQQPFSRDY
jgi:hypothetical protein